MKAERLRVAMFSTIVGGGAGYAALRVHDSLRLCGADSTLYVGRAERSRHPGVQRIPYAEEGPQPSQIPGLTIFSVDAPGIPEHLLDDIIARSDVFNLHWYARFLSVRNIDRLSRSGKPVIMTIRDMNPLSGGCHFFHGCDNWQRDCVPCPQFIPDHLILPGATLDAKRALWNVDNITVVVLSDHTARLVERSSLLRGCRLEKIPNPVDLSIFKPHDRDKARAALGIPTNKHAIAYLPSFSSSVKGAPQAIAALKCLSSDLPVESCVVVCAGDLDKPLDVPFETIEIGFITDRHKLARFYSAADVTLIPSTEETFSNTAAESVACGTPVVGFRVGAIPEIAQGTRGCAVPVADIGSLADGLRARLLESKADRKTLHRYVEDSFGARAIGERYLTLFEALHRGVRFRASQDQVWASQASRPGQCFDRLLIDYRKMRCKELSEERESRKRETGIFRRYLRPIWRGIGIFFTDNKAFRRRVRGLLEDWR